MWIEYGKHDNSMWINPAKVTSVRSIGRRGSRGSIITFDNGHVLQTGYPSTQLVAMLGLRA